MAVSAADSPRDERFQSSRAQFLSSLASRLGALHEALTALIAGAETPGALAVLGRRLKAMGDAASTLQFEEMAQAFAAAHELLSGEGSPSARAFQEVRSLLDLVPNLVPDVEAESGLESAVIDEELRSVGPLRIVALLSSGQQVLLRRALRGAEGVRVHGAATLSELATAVNTYEPDWLVVDGRRADAAEAVARFRVRACLVVDAAEYSIARFKAAGAREVAPEGQPLRRTLVEALRRPKNRPSDIVPKADGATIARVVEDAAQQFRESLLVGLSAHESQQLLTPNVQSALEALTWSAISKMRDLIHEASGGAIQYPERAPEGALLLTGKAALRHSRHPTADTSNLKGRRVLIADDDPAIAWFLGSVLRAAGAEVLEARDGLEALRAARRELPDLVISDVMMPELDGFALCRNLKRDVLLSDVPVILLSWKEDLLQRVRELGVGAAGYLPKETEPTIIVERCCEAIEPRVRIERRLREREVVHGRLDGVTPRLVLELASKALDNARVTFKDAAFSYELWVGDGRILSAARVGAQGMEERGAGILAGLLGMRAGRFVVEPSRETVQAELFGSLAKLIAPHVERARRALAQLQGTRVYDVQRLDLDYTAIAPYLASSPTIMAKLVERLVQGAAPSSLLQQVSAGLLESVLSDLALRGAVIAAWSSDGEDLLAPTREPVEAFDVDLGPPRPGTVVQSAQGAPKVTAQSTPADAERAAAFAEHAIAVLSQSSAPAVAERSEALALHDGAAEVEPSVAEPEVPAALVDLFADEPGSELPPSEESALPSNVSAEPPNALADEDLVTPPLARASELPLAPAAKSSPAAEGYELFHALLQEESPAPPARASSAPAASNSNDETSNVARRTEVEGEAGSVKETAAPSEHHVPVRGMSLAEPVRTHATTGQLVARNLQQRPTLTGLGFPSPPRKVDWHEFIGEDRVDAAWAAAQPGDLDRSPVDALDVLFGDAASPRRTNNPEADSAMEPEDEAPVAQRGLGATPTSWAEESKVAELPGFEHPVMPRALAEASVPTNAPPKLEVVSDDRVEPLNQAIAPEAKTSDEVEAAAEAPEATVAPVDAAEAKVSSRILRVLLPAAIVLGTGGTVFGLSSVVWNRLAARAPSGAVANASGPALATEENVAALQPASKVSAPLAEDDDLSREPVGARAAALALRTLTLPLPENLQLGPDNGLLEVSTDGKHKIYVNDVFVGRGPLRRVPLKPGRYTLVLRLDGSEQQLPVDVSLAKRTRVEPDAPAAPKP